MPTFCASGDCLIHIPVPKGHEGCRALAEEIRKADVRIVNLETTVADETCYASTFSGGTPLKADPARLEDVKALGFQICIKLIQKLKKQFHKQMLKTQLQQLFLQNWNQQQNFLLLQKKINP